MYKFPIVKGLEDVSAKLNASPAEDIFGALLHAYALRPIEDGKSAQAGERMIEYLERAFEANLPDANCVRIKLKKGSLEGVRKWFQTLRERSDEVIETLENEGVIIESVFLDHIGEDDYLVYYMRAENFSTVKEVVSKSTLPIDLYHKDCMRQYCEGREGRHELEQLMDIHRF